jgi:anti-anti-sigma regulatory factor
MLSGMTEVSSNPLRAVDTVAKDGTLTVIVRKEFDAGNVHQDWAQQIQIMHPGPYTLVTVDCSACGLLSSTFFAGIMQLQSHYGEQGSPPLVLFKPDPRIVKNLTILRLNSFFNIIAR